MEWVFASQETLSKLTRSTRDHYCSGSFLSRYPERLVRLVYLPRSLVYLPYQDIMGNTTMGGEENIDKEKTLCYVWR